MVNKNNYGLPVGTILDSGQLQYKIVNVLGQGGFGITYLATATIQIGNIPAKMQFAIKEHYIPSMNGREGTKVSVSNENNTEEVKESIDSFIVEAQRLNRLSLNHPGIVRVNENFRANGTAYYVMEYVKGQSLRDYVRQSVQGRLPEDEALKLFKPIAEVIGYLHDNKLTHLDIKPDNILIRENGQPVVIDFGLSKHYDKKGTPTSTINTAGCSAGYSPMEQYVGITTFTPEADIYALAATLLYMLSGKDPVVATEMRSEFIANSLAGKASLSTISAVSHAMGKLKENRTKEVNQLVKDLFGIVSQKPQSNNTRKIPTVNKRLEQKTKDKPEQTKAKRHKYVWIVAFVILIGFVLFTIINKNGKFENKTPYLKDKIDSLSYTIGMAQTLGLVQYLDSALNVDTMMMAEFKEGLVRGAGLENGSYPEYKEYEQQNAFNAGLQIGENISNRMIMGINHEVFQEDSTKTISLKFFMKGFIDAIDHNYRIMSLEDANSMATELLKEIKTESLELQYSDYLKANKDYLVENAKKSDVRTLPSGVQYKIIKEGSGTIPTEDDVVTVHYEGRTIDGHVFDSSYQKGKSVSLRCNQVIEGWTDALIHMSEGSI